MIKLRFFIQNRSFCLTIPNNGYDTREFNYMLQLYFIYLDFTFFYFYLFNVYFGYTTKYNRLNQIDYLTRADSK